MRKNYLAQVYRHLFVLKMTLTRAQAFRLYGFYDLPDKIYELRKKYRVHTQLVSPRRGGAKYAIYMAETAR